MKRIIILLFLIASFFTAEVSAVTPPSTQGSMFFFSIMRGREGRTKDLTMSISSPANGVAIFTSPTGVKTTINIVAGSNNIPLAHIDGGSSNENTVGGDITTAAATTGTFPDCYTIKANNPEKKGYMIQTFLTDKKTELKVSVYAGLSGANTVDVANIYPVEALGNKYYVVSRPGNTVGPNGNGYWPSEALIVNADTTASVDIEILPTCVLDGQAASDDINKIINVTLKKGETYLLRAQSGDILANGNNDLTGTLVRVKDDGNTSGNKCKKIALFAGSQHGSGVNDPYNNGDYEYDQMFPVHLWGSNYIVGSTDSYGSMVVRVVASQPCTDVTCNGKHVATLNQSEYYQYRDSFNVGCSIHTNKPVEAGLFTTGQNTGSNADGGPALIILAPQEQYLTNITFAATANANITQHSVLVTSLTSICDSTKLNGQYLPTYGATWTKIPSDTTYSQAIVAGIDPNTTYTLINDQAPDKGGFTAVVYGSQGKNAGYGYSAGSAARKAQTTFYINGDPSANSDAPLGCQDKVLDCQATVVGSYSTIEWDFGDGTAKVIKNYPDNTVSHTYATAGLYTITLTVNKMTSDCYTSGLTETATTSIQIVDRISYNSATVAAPMIVCKGSTIKSAYNSTLPNRGFINPPAYYWSTSTPTNPVTTESITLTDDYGIGKWYSVKMMDMANCKIVLDSIFVKTKDIKGSAADPIIPTILPDQCKGTSIKSYGDTEFGGNTPSYKWNTGETTKTINITNNYGETKTYWVQNTYPVNGCMVVDTIIVKAKDIVQNPASGTITQCKGTTITSLSSNHPDFGGNTPTYLWNTGETSKTINITNDFGETKTYSVKNVYPANGCMVVDNFTISTPAKLDNSINADPQKVCGDGKTEVTVTATSSGSTNDIFEMKDGSGSFVPLSGLQYKFNPTETTDFRITSVSTCEGPFVKEASVTANPPFEVKISSKSDQFLTQNSLPSAGGAVTYTADIVTPIDITGFAYAWNPIKGNVSSFTDQVTQTSNNVYTVLVQDPDKLCSATATSDAITLGKVTLTTLINPNGDSNKLFGKTDFITGEDISTNLGNYTITIFNRYGQKIASVGTEGWDGTYNGKVADAGVYFYVIQFKDVNGKLQEMKGSVEVVK